MLASLNSNPRAVGVAVSPSALPPDSTPAPAHSNLALTRDAYTACRTIGQSGCKHVSMTQMDLAVRSLPVEEREQLAHELTDTHVKHKFLAAGSVVLGALGAAAFATGTALTVPGLVMAVVGVGYALSQYGGAGMRKQHLREDLSDLKKRGELLETKNHTPPWR